MQNVAWGRGRGRERESQRGVEEFAFVEFVALMLLAMRLIIMKDRCKVACLLHKHLFRFSLLLPCPAGFTLLSDASGIYSLV